MDGIEIGLTKRELFAAMAMQGMLANPHDFESVTERAIAKSSVDFADALIAELKKR